MADQMTNYQCPACTGPLQFSAATGKLECEYCGSSFEVAQVEALYAAKEEKAAAAKKNEWDTSGAARNWGQDAAGMKAYNCPSCGAELICDETSAATSCPYCGNPTVIPGQFSGSLRPECIIPFRLTKADAIAKLKGHYKGKPFLPKTFTNKQSIEKIQGVYVPFWLYDGTVSGDYRYDATVVEVHKKGDLEIVTTNHFLVHRAGSISFEKVPVDASSKMPDDYMDSIEPFDYSELKPFSTAYLPGFLADKYDVTVKACNKRADKRCVQTLEQALSGTLQNYTAAAPIGEKIVDIQRGKAHYALLPVWLLNVKWNGKIHLFAINGQTGKVCGELPVSKGSAWAFFFKLAVPLSILGTALAFIITG